MRTRRIDLALQGGGTHGAFTWGVLDRLLEDERIRFGAISGSSAGAMNAVALAAGWTLGGRKGARESLRCFWSKVAERLRLATWADAWLGLMRNGAIDASVPFRAAFEVAQAWLAPTLDANPLRGVLQETVDFDAVRRCTEMQLYIGATEVRSGQLRIFDGPSLTPDIVLASACLPTLFPAVMIDGEAYWDGGYMGNPSLLPLLDYSPNLDLMLVQLHPSRRQALPRTATQIVERIQEIGFHGSLVKELRSLAVLQRVVRDEGLDTSRMRMPLLRKAGKLRVHRIEGGEQLDPLAVPRPLQSAWHHLLDLRREGHAAADGWLQENAGRLGRRGTVDLIAEYLGNGGRASPPPPGPDTSRRASPGPAAAPATGAASR
ncbi:MAG: patatin-like phospholipase family protein [Burkholderiales bacterium]|nr:patatin-like phospholipase family protein [Burkholderiales bacterium]